MQPGEPAAVHVALADGVGGAVAGDRVGEEFCGYAVVYKSVIELV
jgi:hypothetical protein